MKKAFDQTVRDLKREVNKSVLKVPRIEQKVLDATSNESWGPHGSLLADIAQATRNFHEYQMIMTVIWKRINDTGKNWRHVYKSLIVLDYLVAHGSERVIDEIREHAYQISTLSDFQYIDSSGRDQGSNVRKKSQSLVTLVNDKERIVEVREKAAVNRDKFRNTSSTGGMYKPSSYSNTGGYGDRYDENRYEGRYRDEDRNGREREYGYRDEDRNDRNGGSYGREDDRYGRDYEERHGRDSYRDDDYWGRNPSAHRSRSSDRERDRASDDDGQHSSRSIRADDQSQNGRRLDRKFSEQNIGAPPSYEEALSESRSPVHSERGGETSAASASRSSFPPITNILSQSVSLSGTSAAAANQDAKASDEFDPRGSISAAPTISKSADMDLFGSLSESPPDLLAIVPTVPATSTISEPDAHTNSGAPPSFVASSSATEVRNQSFEDPFGDSPFTAVPSSNGTQAGASEAVSNFGNAHLFSAVTYPVSSVSSVQPPSVNSQLLPQESLPPHQDVDILADILPPGPSPSITSQTTAPGGQHSHATFAASSSQPSIQNFSSPGGLQAQQAFPSLPPQSVQPNANTYNTLQPQLGNMALVATNIALQPQSGQLSNGVFPQQGNSGGFFMQHGGSTTPIASHMALQAPSGQPVLPSGGHFNPYQEPAVQFASHVGQQFSSGPSTQHKNDTLGNFFPPAAPNTPMAQPLSSSSGSVSAASQPSKDKFETKSTVWADTLSRGLVNLNISGQKVNPLADIGIDFDALNRKDKRMEKPSTAPVTSTVNMGKAMGSGSGVGRAGATALRPPVNPMMGSGMGMGLGASPGLGMGVGTYGGMNQPMGMGMNMGMNMGRGMNMGMGQGLQIQPPAGLPPGSNMSGSYYPMMGGSGYPQQPYGGGAGSYR